MGSPCDPKEPSVLGGVMTRLATTTNTSAAELVAKVARMDALGTGSSMYMPLVVVGGRVDSAKPSSSYVTTRGALDETFTDPLLEVPSRELLVDFDVDGLASNDCSNVCCHKLTVTLNTSHDLSLGDHLCSFDLANTGNGKIM